MPDVPAGTGALRRPGLVRRMAAIFYDCLLLASVLFVGTALILPLYGGRAVPANDPLYTAYLALLSLLYFGWFWTHGGRTPGMLAWSIRLRRTDGGAPGWHEALVRFALAALSWTALGCGFLWALIDREGLTWHDRLSRTELVLEPRR